MDFRTQVELPKPETEITYRDKIMLFGSCFAENMGKRLSENNFDCDSNPFGILYNPQSIHWAIERVMEGTPYTATELIPYEGQWHSPMHHTQFSAKTTEECLQKINNRLQQAHQNIQNTQWMIITWGTAWVYRDKQTNEVVGNCHKMPARNFIRQRLTVEEITNTWVTLIDQLRKIQPQMKILFTLSPIRHRADGMHQNQLSKATLMLAMDEICTRMPQCYYFPAYELMNDELRDYRFYAEDMIHPSEVAIEYLWECFCNTWMVPSTRHLMEQWKRLRKRMEHRPHDPTSEQYQRFCQETERMAEELRRVMNREL